MDKLRKQLIDFDRASSRLEEALKKAKQYRNSFLFPFFRDSAIQRFEFTFEIFWKLIKTSLKILEGIECNSPKSCIRSLFKTGYTNKEETIELLSMVDDRNLTVHTYNEQLADELFNRLEKHLNLTKRVVERIKRALSETSEWWN